MEAQLQYSGFWRRAAASFLDAIIFAVPSILLNILLFKIINAAMGYGFLVNDFFYGRTPNEVNYAIYAISYPIWAYVLFRFFTSKWQATPGKRIMSIYVADKNGEKVTTRIALKRIILPMLLVLSLIPITSQTLQKDDAHYQFIYDTEQVMPNFTQELINSDEVALVFIGKIEKDENLKELYMNEYMSLSDDNKKAMNAAGKVLIESAQNPAQLIVILVWFVVFAIWYLLAAFTKQKTTIHDLIAGTRILKGKPNENKD